jgi:tetratricopeptide (TPR) repeat protein
MWGWHPSREQLERHVQDDLPLPQRRRMARHLSGCSLCERRERRMSAEVSQSIPVSYEGAIQRAALGAAVWLKRLEDESHHARDLLAELLRDSGHEPLDRLRQAPPALSLKLLRLIQERCRASWSQEPVRAVELAHLEVAVAERLDNSRCGSGVAADSRALAWADLGNSYRILSDFGTAELALKKAAEHQRLSGDPLTESEILDFLASLRKHQGRYSEAFANCDRVIEIARQGEDRHREGRALIAKGTAASDRAFSGRGDFRESIRLLRKGMVRIDLACDPDLKFIAQHNFVNSLNAAGRSLEAEQILRRIRYLYDDLGRGSFLSKLHWLEGSIAESLGRIHEAEVNLRKAREIFSQQQLVLDVASVSLHLGMVLCRQEQYQEARRLVEEAIPIFEVLGIEADITAARFLALRLRS